MQIVNSRFTIICFSWLFQPTTVHYLPLEKKRIWLQMKHFEAKWCDFLRQAFYMMQEVSNRKTET